MEQFRCTECGQMFSLKLEDCPECGCPASECEVVDVETSPMDAMPDIDKEEQRNDMGMSDMGYENEKTVIRFANIIFIFTIIVGVSVFISTLVSAAAVIGGISFATFIGGALGASGIILVGYTLRAFYRIFASMSINLHEINKKLK